MIDSAKAVLNALNEKRADLWIDADAYEAIWSKVVAGNKLVSSDEIISVLILELECLVEEIEERGDE